MSDSVELKTVKMCRQQLETALMGLGKKLVCFLSQKGFITDEDHEKICNPESFLSEADKAGIIAKRIVNRIQQDSDDYHKLVHWFKLAGIHYQPIVNTLDAEYKRQSNPDGDSEWFN